MIVLGCIEGCMQWSSTSVLIKAGWGKGRTRKGARGRWAHCIFGAVCGLGLVRAIMGVMMGASWQVACEMQPRVWFMILSYS